MYAYVNNCVSLIITIVEKTKTTCAVAKAIIDNDVHVQTIKFPDPRAKNPLQATRANQLMKDAGLQGHVGGCGIPELQKLQAFLTPGYQIKVWCMEKFDKLIFEGPKAQKLLHLYLHENHYDVITSIFFDNSYWCETCNKGYEHQTDHKC